jgi:Uma2 family endonuclease
MSALASPAQTKWIRPEDYLAAEDLAEFKNEYLGGSVYAMAGGSRRHNLIARNIVSALGDQLAGKPCQSYIGDVKVRIDIAKDTYFYYPDVMVGCNPKDNHPLYLKEPKVIVEVLSPSTERIDRREKFFIYQRIDSFDTYILVDQNKREVTIYRKDVGWSAEVFVDTGEIALDSIGCHVSLDRIYRDVEFD